MQALIFDLDGTLIDTVYAHVFAWQLALAEAGRAIEGLRPEINTSLEALGVGEETVIIERGDVSRAKPEPDLFLACQQRLGVRIEECYVV
jgi:beta-phosphoglucomutase-like phosphatase (HAD superfamily)